MNLEINQNTTQPNTKANTAADAKAANQFYGEGVSAAVVGTVEKEVNNLVGTLQKYRAEMSNLALKFADIAASNTRIASYTSAGISAVGAGAGGYGAVGYGNAAADEVSSMKNLTETSNGLDSKIATVDQKLNPSSSLTQENETENLNNTDEVESNGPSEEQKKGLQSEKDGYNKEKQDLKDKYESDKTARGHKSTGIYQKTTALSSFGQAGGTIPQKFAESNKTLDDSKQSAAQSMASAAESQLQSVDTTLGKALNVDVTQAAVAASRG